MNNCQLDFQFDHPGITVYDINKTIDWYKNNFEYEEVKRFEKPSLGIKGVQLKLKNSSFEILQPLPTDIKLEDLLQELGKPGTMHLAFNTNDINLAYNTLKEKNILITELFDSKLFFYKDSDKTLIEIRQRK